MPKKKPGKDPNELTVSNLSLGSSPVKPTRNSARNTSKKQTKESLPELPTNRVPTNKQQSSPSPSKSTSSHENFSSHDVSLGGNSSSPRSARYLPTRTFSATPLYLLSVKLKETMEACNTHFYTHQSLRRKRESTTPTPTATPPIHESLKRQSKQKKPDFSQAPDGTSNNGYDNDEDDYIWRAHEILANRYELKKLMGKGSFGQVVEALDMETNQSVAIKIIKSRPLFTAQAQIELQILGRLQLIDQDDEHNIVRMMTRFEHRNHVCIVYELLSYNLYELLRIQNFAGISLNLIRKLSIQILMSLKFLASPEVGIIHCDLKPENILLRDPKKPRLKLIDFGSSCFVGNKMHTYIQSRYYRCPEVLLGMEYGTSIDMWSLGCVLVELLTGKALFPGKDELDQINSICSVLGDVPHHFLKKAHKAKISAFFEQDGQGHLKLKASRQDWSVKRSLTSIVRQKLQHEQSLRTSRPHLGNAEEEIELFLDLVGKMLVFDPTSRITPTEALAHPFFEPLGMIITNNSGIPPAPAVMARDVRHPVQERSYSASSTSSTGSIPANLGLDSPTRYYAYDRLPEPYNRT